MAETVKIPKREFTEEDVQNNFKADMDKYRQLPAPKLRQEVINSHHPHAFIALLERLNEFSSSGDLRGDIDRVCRYHFKNQQIHADGHEAHQHVLDELVNLGVHPSLAQDYLENAMSQCEDALKALYVERGFSSEQAKQWIDAQRVAYIAETQSTVNRLWNSNSQTSRRR